MGATLLADQGLAGSGATFRAWAPRATAVYVNGVFDGVPLRGQTAECLMVKDANGTVVFESGKLHADGSIEGNASK